ESDRRNRVNSCLECQRQAEERALEIEVRQRIALGYDLGYAVKTAHEASKRLLNFQHDACAACANQRGIAAELNRVSETLFTVQQNCLAGDIIFAQPERL